MRVGLDPPQHFEAVHFGHFQVEENQLQAVFAAAVRIGARAEDEVERLGPVAYYLDALGEVGLLQGAERQFHIVGVIFGQ